MSTSVLTPTVPQPLLHSQLEVDALTTCAQSVPVNGTILEIGTGPGGSSCLLRAQSHPSVNVFSLDVNQRVNGTAQKLGGLGISFMDGTSPATAAGWTRPIDFLFVDAGHRLGDIAADVLAWLPHMRPGARIAFHDFATPVAGGIFQYGCKLAVDTLVRTGVVAAPSQYLSLLTGMVPDPHATVTAADFVETLRQQARLISSIRDHFTPSLLDWLLANDGTGCRELIESGPGIPFHPQREPQHPICGHLNQAMMCYLWDLWMKEHRPRAQHLIETKENGFTVEMMIWLDAERRDPYPYVCTAADIKGRDWFPFSIENYKLDTINEVSRFATLETVRLNMLCRLTNQLFDRILKSYR